MKRFIIFCSALFLCLRAAAELPEGLTFPGDSIVQAVEPVEPAAPAHLDVTSDYVPRCLLSDSELQRRFGVDMRYVPSMSPMVTSWRNGGVWVDGGRVHAYGMAGVESGSINVGQRIGNVTLSAYAGAKKTGFYRGLSSQWLFGGRMQWHISPRLSLTLYGSYATDGYVRGMSPGLAETLSMPNFGGYLTWNISEHWGVDVGASMQTDNLGRWEARPIVAPFYRLGDTKLRIDVGGIVYEALRSRVQRNMNPTIGPPKPVILIAPRR